MGTGIGYSWLFRWVLFLHGRYYRKIEVEGLKHIPEGRVIFSPNHQNAIMDALAVLCTVKKPVFFLARGDFFRNRWLAVLLHFLKIYPAYRKIEGFDQLTQNYATLELACRWLLSGNPVCIFPEGGHEGSWRLRPLSKGLFRLALETQSESPREPVYIVPVGIYYSSYTQWGATLHIKFGKPVNTHEVYRTWKMNKARGINQLRDRVGEAMQQVVLRADEKFYNFIVNMAPYVAAHYGETEQYEVIQQFVDHCNRLSIAQPEVMQQASQKFESCYARISRISVPPQCLVKEMSLSNFIRVSLTRLFIIPFVLPILIYLSPFLLVTGLINRFISDRQFHSSVRFILLSLLPLWHGVVFVIIWQMAHSALLAAAISIFFFVTTASGYRTTGFFSRWKREWTCYRNREQIQWIQQQINDIIQMLNFTYPYVAERKTREDLVSRY